MEGTKKMLILAGLLLAGVSSLFARNTVLYVHGMKFKDYSYCHGKSECREWDAKKGKYKGAWATQRIHGDIYHVGYDGRQDPHNFTTHGRGGYMLLKALNDRCRGYGNNCEIVCGSMGCHIAGDTLSRYGQLYNVSRVIALASGEGGSDMGQVANNILNLIVPRIAHYAFGEELQAWLTDHTGLPYGASYRMRPEIARSSYDHNDTRGTLFYNKASYVPVVGWALQVLNVFPGRNDFVSAHHSTCAYPAIKPYQQCGGETIRKNCKVVAGVRICWGKKVDYRPWENHYAGEGVSREGVKGEFHGYFSSKGQQYHYYNSRIP